MIDLKLVVKTYILENLFRKVKETESKSFSLRGMVVDSTSAKMLSSCFTMDELAAEGITFIDSLDKYREPYPTMEGVYLINPTEINIKEVISDIQNDYTKTQYTNTIEPFFVKNINYSEIAVDHYKDGLIQGGPKTDYNNLISSMELWNVATFKLETLNTGEYYLKSLNLLLEKLITQIEKEINNP